MIIVRPTARLARSGRSRIVDDPPRARAPLGEWYATLVDVPRKPRSLVVYRHTGTGLAVVTSGSTCRGTVKSFRDRLAALLGRMDVSEAKISQQIAAMGEVVYASPNDEEAVGATTRSARLVYQMVLRGRSDDPELDAIEDELAGYPEEGQHLTPRLAIRELLVARTLR